MKPVSGSSPFSRKVSSFLLSRDTAFGVAQIFSVLSRNFHCLDWSAAYSARNAGCELMARRVLSGTTEQGWEEVMLSVNIDNIGDLAVVEYEGRIVRSEAAFKLRDAAISQNNARILVPDLSDVYPLKAVVEACSHICSDGLATTIVVSSCSIPQIRAAAAGARQLDVRVRHCYARGNAPGRADRPIRASYMKS